MKKNPDAQSTSVGPMAIFDPVNERNAPLNAAAMPSSAEHNKARGNRSVSSQAVDAGMTNNPETRMTPTACMDTTMARVVRNMSK